MHNKSSRIFKLLKYRCMNKRRSILLPMEEVTILSSQAILYRTKQARYSNSSPSFDFSIIESLPRRAYMRAHTSDRHFETSSKQLFRWAAPSSIRWNLS
ncbi:hypothetical protein BC939DRAFT_446138 [Gamsiella multidivaricata]|uniref:uncharacterized protein n=1 Tax=Gamsiella multidivaricata TaxID=101098 RepID=UPI0022202CF1|nr:uncharacterized protein BC939DRAFT_446138 [Gamsiella multidivaricata]KAI7826894.1 hypothetical protein BC939DRAFT_446138 [Gamsiella multidivaricata]